MTDAEIIAEMTRRNMALEADYARLKSAYGNRVEEIKYYDQTVTEISAFLDYQGYHGNLPDLVKQKLGK